MLGIIGTLGSAIVSGVSNYFTTKQEIKKVKVEAEKKVIVAEVEAKIKRMDKEADQDFTLDQMSMNNMRDSWKDEVVLIVWLAPVIMCFIPTMQPYVVAGFEALSGTPDWYQWILIGLVVVIYGLRGLLRSVLQLLINKVGK